ncbi:MAG: STAS domain-containing protein [Chloroflexi bacterium]|nr:STAS domain-containing protein [Chloroflexota bacterium]
MNVKIEHPQPNIAVVRPKGRIDAATSSQFRDLLRRLPSQGVEHVIIDLRDVSFMDSSGLSALVAGLKLIRRKGGALVLVGPQPPVRMALQLTMLDRVFRIYNSLRDAVAAVNGRHY